MRRYIHSQISSFDLYSDLKTSELHNINIIIVNDYASVQGGTSQVVVASTRGLTKASYHVTFEYGTRSIDSSLHHSNIELIDLKQYNLLLNPSKINAIMVWVWNRSVEKQIHVVLDSLHGTCFSINFNIPFIVTMPPTSINHILSLLSKVNAKNRIVQNILLLLEKSVDFNLINQKLQLLRSISKQYLDNASGEIIN
ncbi:MAG: hypothetical protein GQ531_00670 [Sulfurovum sp.]|nr:hypothetical protein [Sulfurovum sp.]